MSPRTDISERRRNQILDAATTVFVRLGFQHARMDDIVEESGLSKGTLYWYFKSKEDIINAILRRLFTGELENLESLLEAEGTVSERIAGDPHPARYRPGRVPTRQRERSSHLSCLYVRRVNHSLVDGSSDSAVGHFE